MTEWIKCSERLPEIVQDSGDLKWSTEVLCYLNDGSFLLAHKTNFVFWKDWNSGLTVKNENVTHWMPLPTPPEDEK
jgi:hypothetical protein